MRTSFRPFSVGIVGPALAVVVMPLGAQWTNYRTPGIPRTKDGTPKVSSPAPRTADGKPDLSGIWQVSTDKYLANLGADGAQGCARALGGQAIPPTPGEQRARPGDTGETGRADTACRTASRISTLTSCRRS